MVEVVLHYFLRDHSNLTCLDYYFWERMKELAYFQRPITSENMKEIMIQELERVQTNFPRRLQACLDQHVKYFEQLLQ